MTILSATTVKTFFQTGDKPTQSDFTDLIDTAIRPSLVAIATAAEADKTGVVAILGSTEATAYSHGTVGRQLLSSITTASASNHLGIAAAGAVGALLQAAITTASAQGHLGAGAVGTALLESTGTASAQDKLGAGTVGKMLIEAVTTASAANALNVGSGSTSLLVQMTARMFSAIEGTSLGATNAFVNTQVLVSTTPASSASKFLITAVINGAANNAGALDTARNVEFTLFRNGDDLAIEQGTSSLAFIDWRPGSANATGIASSKTVNSVIQYLDSPSTIGTVTYRIKVRSSTGGVIFAMNSLTSGGAAGGNNQKAAISTISLMELSS